MDNYKSSKTKQQKVFQILVNDEKSIKEVMMFMQYVISMVEQRRENRLRMKLVREREIACAGGDAASCDLYYYGFLNENELAYDGIPSKYNTPPKARKVYQHPGNNWS